MTNDSAERWVTISALIVAGIYAYRRLVEPAQPGKLKNVVGVGEPVPLGQFATAWGFTFLVVAVMASASPGLGGSFAILIATGDVLTNSASVFADVGKGETAKATSSKSKSSTVQNVTVPVSPVGHTNIPGGTSEAAATSGEVGH